MRKTNKLALVFFVALLPVLLLVLPASATHYYTWIDGPEVLELQAGQTLQLEFLGQLYGSDGPVGAIQPAGAESAELVTNNPSVATISTSGLLTAHAVGTAIITAYGEMGESSIEVRVAATGPGPASGPRIDGNILLLILIGTGLFVFGVFVGAIVRKKKP